MAGELILLVDDEAHIVELARMYLEREGFRVASAADGAPGSWAAPGQRRKWRRRWCLTVKTRKWGRALRVSLSLWGYRQGRPN